MNETGPIPRFRSLYRQSLPGSRVNEDGLGLCGRHAWIIDGATGVSVQRLPGASSDAAWLSGEISTKIQDLAASERAAEAIFGALEGEISRVFTKAIPPADAANDDHAPSACLGLIGLRSGLKGETVVEGSFLGDVVALVPTEQGVVRWTDERAKPFEKRTLAALGGATREPGQVPEAVRRQILENRTKLNRPDGYWVVNPLRSWAGRELRFEARLAPDQPIVLATDGFMRLVDVFATYSDASLHTALAQGRGEALMQELRDLESGDPMADAYPRVKTHDDATVLVIAAESYG
ncbi:hypothetical protein [Microvirga terricola]|uniref:Protein phosphatase 2C n=1 Tax=Microvirga terricola TaxID=2719797 RepID=A0ABX0VA07_9HYPH|nr:hypothetical protein [Microvirga terricola]NIX76383.1 hypothetical protein [Microvirga terricola]